MTLTNWSRLILVLVAALVVQVAVVDQVSIDAAHADVMVLLAAAAGLVAGPGKGGLVGFVVGLFADLILPTPYGLSSLAFVFVAFGTGMLVSAGKSATLLSARALVCAAAGAIGTLGYALLAAVFGQPGMLTKATLWSMLAVLVGGLVLSWPALWAMGWALAGTARAIERRPVPGGGSATT